MKSIKIVALRGDTWNGQEYSVTVNGSPLNLAGTQIDIEFRAEGKTGQLKKALSVGDGITVNDAANGEFSIDPFVIDLAVGVYFFDIQFTFPDGKVKTYVEGQFLVTQDTTVG